MKSSVKHMANSKAWPKFTRNFALLALCCGTLLGCHFDMWNQPRYKPLRPSENFSDGASSRARIPNTVLYDAQRRPWTAPETYTTLTGQRQIPSVMDERFYTGQEPDGAFIADNYFQVTPALLARGKERFEISCAPCHGFTGDGSGIIISRGFPQPTSYHIDRLREVEDGYLFDVMTNGFGRMYRQAERVKPEDRWAIAAYIRALQFSQNPDIELLTPEDRQNIEHPPTDNQHGEGHHAH